MNHLITDNMDIWTAAQTQKSNGGRGRGSNSNGQSSHGIKKLLELILELAVRGKLVPQDPNDEPASVFLERIAKEKKRLIKEGKIKKEKPLPEIGEDEKPFDLPQVWTWVRLGEALIKITDGTHHSPPNDEKGEFLYITAKNIKSEGILLSNATYVTRETHQEIYSRCDPEYGDILYIKDGATTGVVTINNLEDPFSMLSSVALLKAPTSILNTYLLLSLKSPYFYNLMRSGMTGVAITRVTLTKLNNAFIPLPPLPEQHRIVAKVDELMALCDQLEQQQTDSNDTHQTLVETLLVTLTKAADSKEFSQTWQRIADHFDTLFTTEHSIDQLKQTILQLAVMGKLVPHDPNDEPASVLLEKIVKEKRRLIKEGKIKKEKPVQAIGKDEKLFGLPIGWEWARLGMISYQITDGTHFTPVYTSEGVPFLSVKDMSSGHLDFSNTRLISTEQHEALSTRCNPCKGDLLLTKVGTTGIPILIETDIPFSIFVSVALIKFAKSQISGKFLALLFKSPFVTAQSIEGTEGIGNKNLVLRKIEAFLIVIPPLSEQHRIVAKVDELMALCDELKARLNAAQTTQLQLADAIVEKAAA